MKKINYEKWAEYRRVCDEMAGDAKLVTLKRELEIAKKLTATVEDQLSTVEAPYQKRLNKILEEIESIVLEAGRSITLYDVAATLIDGRKSTSWKKVATEAGAGPVLIAEHTKVSPPKVKIEVVV